MVTYFLTCFDGGNNKEKKIRKKIRCVRTEDRVRGKKMERKHFVQINRERKTGEERGERRERREKSEF